MLHLVASEQLDVLAGHLGGVLAEPLADPMAPEWIVVVNAGTERWLRLSLAEHLGIAANLELMFPGRLVNRLLTPDAGRDDDPWHLDRLSWAVLDVLCAGLSDEHLGSLTRLPPGGTWWGRARRVADLFDRYGVHRPAMLRSWAAGDDVDGAGAALAPGALWQPHLWRLVRERIGSPSPAELLPDRIAALRDGACPPEVPERVSLFGLTTVPGGAPFLELIDALATQREVHLLLSRPSVGLTHDVPLLNSWARPARDAEQLLAGRPVTELGSPASSSPGSLLEQVQADLIAGRAPAGSFVPTADDRSIRMHSCHGITRQVEVLRDELLHLLAADHTLDEDDIVVLCPAINEYAPFIEAVFGPSAPAGATDGFAPTGVPPAGPPALAYRITDRSLRDTSPLYRALAALVDLLAGRFSAPALVEFASLAPVRTRFGFDDAALSTISDWVERTDVRWGLDGEHRDRWGVPADHTGGSWAAALDRLLCGIAVSDDDDLPLAVGDVLPYGVEGGNVGLAGRLADLISRLGALADEAQAPRTGQAWSALLDAAADELFAVDPSQQWQQTRLTATLTAIAEHAEVAGSPVDALLTLADVRRLVGQLLGATASRPDFFRGGITISSLTPLRGIPHRVICLLGMDEGAFATTHVDGDDLTVLDPVLGDRDRRAETRQALLESVLAARDRLVVLRSGHSVITNQPVPPSVPVAELRDTVLATVADDVRDDVSARLERVHPRQAFDERNFAPDAPWSFDPVACEGARSRATASRELTPLVAAPLPSPELGDVIDLAELRAFLDHPVQHFLRNVLQVSLPRPPEPSGGGPGTDGPDLLLELGVLDAWKIKDRLLTHRLAGRSVESFTLRERARGSLPPGRLADAALASTADAIEPLVAAVTELGGPWAEPEYQPIDVTLPSGTRIVGTVPFVRGTRIGPVRVFPSKTNPKRRLATWLDLVALVGSAPELDWCATLITPPASGKKPKVEPFEIPVESVEERSERAIEALEVVVDCFRRGRCEPIPLFPKVSHALHAGKNAAVDWHAFKGASGDGDDRWVQLAFGRASLHELLRIPARDDDPDGRAHSRAERYASYLWGAVDQCLEAVEEQEVSA